VLQGNSWSPHSAFPCENETYNLDGDLDALPPPSNATPSSSVPPTSTPSKPIRTRGHCSTMAVSWTRCVLRSPSTRRSCAARCVSCAQPPTPHVRVHLPSLSPSPLEIGPGRLSAPPHVADAAVPRSALPRRRHKAEPPPQGHHPYLCRRLTHARSAPVIPFS